jgi:CPA2 family monovalent cation:H+ antiporter-2/glutathione-regulated potassium-efflux system protein KefB
MATTPFLMALTKPLRADPGKTKGAERQGPTGDAANALIVGYGRFGQTVAQMLNASGLSVTLIDTDVEMIDVAGGFGAKVYFGDGTRLDLLRQAGADEAALILFCMDGDQMDAAALDAVHQAFPRRRSSCARSIGARWCGSRIARQVGDPRSDGIGREDGAPGAAETGVSEEIIARAEDMYRVRDKERLKIQFEGGDLRAARDRIITEPQAQESALSSCAMPRKRCAS